MVENSALNQSLNIVLLEDDESYAMVVQRLMAKRGHQVAWAADIKALQCLFQTIKDCDLALLDLKLASETSLDSIQSVREHYPSAKIFMVTAYASIATTVEAIKRGADDYLPKPVTIDEILAAYYEGRKIIEEGNDKPLSPKRLEWEHIQRVLQDNDGNISRTAVQLNMHRRTLQRKLQKKPAD